MKTKDSGWASDKARKRYLDKKRKISKLKKKKAKIERRHSRARGKINNH